MQQARANGARFSEADLNFIVEGAAPETTDRPRLKRLILEDESFRRALVGHEALFRRVMADDAVMLRISPALYFEILLRRALAGLQSAGHTVERAGSHRVAVFDTREVVELVMRPPVLDYLTDMLASFIRIESYVVRLRVRRGVWRRLRFNDMDVDSLVRLCATADLERRLGLYKRIADVCLFTLGIFPEYASGGGRRLSGAGRLRWTAAEYEREGRRFYRLAGEHPMAGTLGWSEAFWLLHEKLYTAKKPLNLVAEHFLHTKKHKLFDVVAE